MTRFDDPAMQRCPICAQQEARVRAENRAMRRLATRYPEAFAALVAEEMAKEKSR